MALKFPNDVGEKPCQQLGDAFAGWSEKPGPASQASRGICDNPQCSYNAIISLFRRVVTPAAQEMDARLCSTYLEAYDTECEVARALAERSPDHFNNCLRSRIEAQTNGDTVDGQKMAFIGFELLSGSDLGSFIDNMAAETDYTATLKKMCSDMVTSLDALISAEPKVLHKDIKPENSWWDSTANVLKLIDYGNTRRMEKDDDFFAHGT